MIGNLLGPRETLDVRCTIEIENTFDSLHAHVELEDGIEVQPGDEVRVHGDPIVVPYGEKTVIHRRASLTRANAIERIWTRMTGDLEFMELLEFSFTSGRKL